MKQTGRFFTLHNNKDGKPEDRPVKNLFLFFNQGGVRKVETKTNDNGEFDFDLPVGSYTIQINQGAGFDILDLFAGVPFELTATSSQTSLNDWLMNPVAAGVDSNPIVTRMLSIQLRVNKDANDAKNAKLAMTENGYVNTKQTTLAYLFGSPANGYYYTVDLDPNFLSLTPEGRSAAYVEVMSSYHASMIYQKMIWTQSTGSKKTYEIHKESGAWQTPIEVLKGESIGGVNGKVLKEGAYGLAGVNSKNTPDFNIRDLKNYPRGFSWLYCLSNVTGKPAGNGSLLMSNYADDWASYLYFRDNGWLYHGSRSRGVDSEWAKVYSESTAKKDKNNVLHATTGTPKDTLLVGDLGLGAYKNLSELEKKGFPQGFLFGGDTSSSSSEFGRAGAMMHLGAYASAHFQLHFDIDAKVKFRRGNASTGVWNSPHEFWTTVNTIVDTNGNIKRASPTVELFNDHIKFTGFGDQVPIFEKLAIGTYKISNTHGMARTGWTYQKPQGKDGNYFFKIRVQKLDDGCIVTVHDYYVADEEVEIIDEHGNPRKVKKQVEVLGMPRDIKDNERWINLRFHEQIYSLTNELPELNVPYRELWGIDPYIPPIVEQIEKDIALEDQRAF